MRIFLYCIILLVPWAIVFAFPDLDSLVLQRDLDALQRTLLIPENIRKLNTINPSLLKILQGEINDIAKGPVAEANGISLARISAEKKGSDIPILINAARAKQAFNEEQSITLESNIK